jgi:hypothetical protein
LPGGDGGLGARNPTLLAMPDKRCGLGNRLDFWVHLNAPRSDGALVSNKNNNRIEFQPTI